MRILHILLGILFVMAGLVGAVLLAAVGVVIFLFRRLFGRPATMPRFQRPARSARPAWSGREEVIDVVTTQSKN